MLVMPRDVEWKASSTGREGSSRIKVKRRMGKGGKSKLMLRATQTNSRGFSLVELLIVLAILMVISAIAVPSYMSAKAVANEAAAASSLRAIMSAQSLYRNTFGSYANLYDLGSDYLTDQQLASGQKSGYYFDSTPGARPAYEFTVTGEPMLAMGPSATGARYYFGDESSVVRFSLVGPANGTSPPLQ